jgi:hypothetical protein
MNTDQAVSRKTNRPLRTGAVLVSIVAAWFFVRAVSFLIHFYADGFIVTALIDAVLIYATRFLWKKGAVQADADAVRAAALVEHAEAVSDTSTAALSAGSVPIAGKSVADPAGQKDAAARSGPAKENRVVAAGVQIWFLVAAALGVVAMIGGAALESHYRLLDGLCNGAAQEGLANSTSDNIHCGLDTTLYSIGNLMHVVGIIFLIAGGLGFLAQVAGRFFDA